MIFAGRKTHTSVLNEPTETGHNIRTDSSRQTEKAAGVISEIFLESNTVR